MASLIRRLLGFAPNTSSAAHSRNRHSDRTRTREERPLRILSQPRPRRLSLPSALHPQLQSQLILRIPPELRLLIWEYALGESGVLHLKVTGGILRYRPCYEDKDKLGFRHNCWWDANVAEERKLVSLLLSCKLIYNEAVDLLYQANTFHFRQSEGMIRLPRLILPQRFERIRRIHISTAFHIPFIEPSNRTRSVRDLPDDHKKWPAACDVLASLKDLEELHIEIAIWPWHPDAENVHDSVVQLLSSLRRLRAKKFEVVLTYNIPEDVLVRLGPLPFSLVRRGRPGIGFYLTPDDD